MVFENKEEYERYQKDRETLHEVFDNLGELSMYRDAEMLPEYANAMCNLFKLLYLD